MTVAQNAYLARNMNIGIRAHIMINSIGTSTVNRAGLASVFGCSAFSGAAGTGTARRRATTLQIACARPPHRHSSIGKGSVTPNISR